MKRDVLLRSCPLVRQAAQWFGCNSTPSTLYHLLLQYQNEQTTTATEPCLDSLWPFHLDWLVSRCPSYQDRMRSSSSSLIVESDCDWQSSNQLGLREGRRCRASCLLVVVGEPAFQQFSHCFCAVFSSSAMQFLTLVLHFTLLSTACFDLVCIDQKWEVSTCFCYRWWWSLVQGRDWSCRCGGDYWPEASC